MYHCQISEDNIRPDGIQITAPDTDNDSLTRFLLTDVAKQITDRLGYESGDDFPAILVWPMYEVGLIFTLSGHKYGGTAIRSNTIEGEHDSSFINTAQMEMGVVKIFHQQDVFSKLTYEDREDLLEHVREKVGINQDEVNSLQHYLEQTNSLLKQKSNGIITESEFEKIKSKIITACESDNLENKNYNIDDLRES